MTQSCIKSQGDINKNEKVSSGHMWERVLKRSSFLRPEQI